jgi:hypothetical protein
MCLEDRLLVALYKEQGPVPLVELSNSIFITQNAGLSIVHRVSANFPHFILVEEEVAADSLLLSPNPALSGEVKKFLAGGGFTAINEQEFRDYYKKEMKREKRRKFFSKITSGQTWKRWLAGTGLTIAGGVALATWASKANKSH